MTDKLGICKLCSEHKELRKSHIIPRSYFKHAKSGGQLVWVNAGDEPPKRTNSDPKERMLCHDCEQLLSKRYEAYGTRILLNRNKLKKVKGNENLLIFKNYKYSKLYLYLASILWRALVSDRYVNMNLYPFNDLMRHCILNEKMYIKASLRLDHFLRISIVKIRDKSGQITNEAMRRVILDLNVEETKRAEDGIIYYMMVHGFLIAYHIWADDDWHELRVRKNGGQIRKNGKMFIEVKDITDFGFLVNSFNSAVRQSGVSSKP